jgi:hypothetical protein
MPGADIAAAGPSRKKIKIFVTFVTVSPPASSYCPDTGFSKQRWTAERSSPWQSLSSSRRWVSVLSVSAPRLRSGLLRSRAPERPASSDHRTAQGGHRSGEPSYRDRYLRPVERLICRFHIFRQIEPGGIPIPLMRRRLADRNPKGATRRLGFRFLWLARSRAKWQAGPTPNDLSR